LRQQQGGPRPAFAGDGKVERLHGPRPPASLPPLLPSSPSSLAPKSWSREMPPMAAWRRRQRRCRGSSHR
jgi:hypothetical protein